MKNKYLQAVFATLLISIILSLFLACDSGKNNDDKEPVLWKTYTLDNSALINDFVNCVAVDSDDHIWAGNYYGDVTEFDGSEWTHHVTKDSGIFYNTINKIVIDHDNKVWVGSEYGLFHLENNVWAGSIPPVAPYSFTGIQDIAVGADNSMWVCSRLLWQYYREPLSSYSWLSYEWAPYYSYYYAYRIAVTPNGGLWTMAQSNLMSYYDGLNFIQYLPSIHDIQTAVVDKNSILWIGTRSSGLIYYTGMTWIAYNTENSGLSNNNVHAVAFDKDGDMWIGTDGGLVHYDGAQWTVYNTENSGLKSNNITGIAVDKKNNVWISTYGGGLNVFNPNGL